MLDLTASKLIEWLATPASETNARFSPDGRWVAYVTDAGGKWRAWVHPFQAGQPAPAAKWQVTGDLENFQSRILWRGDTKELFYMIGGTVFSVPVAVKGGTFEPGRPVRLFENPLYFCCSNVDITRDGNRFLEMENLENTGSRPMTVVLNWQQAEGH